MVYIGKTGFSTLRLDDKQPYKEHAFIVEANEAIQAETGSFKSVKIKRLRAEGGKRTTYFWCAPKLY